MNARYFCRCWRTLMVFLYFRCCREKFSETVRMKCSRHLYAIPVSRLNACQRTTSYASPPAAPGESAPPAVWHLGLYSFYIPWRLCLWVVQVTAGIMTYLITDYWRCSSLIYDIINLYLPTLKLYFGFTAYLNLGHSYLMVILKSGSLDPCFSTCWLPWSQPLGGSQSLCKERGIAKPY